jgi:hypothetical protein
VSGIFSVVIVASSNFCMILLLHSSELHVQPTVTDRLTDTMVAELESSTPPIPNSAIGYEPVPVLSTSNPIYLCLPYLLSYYPSIFWVSTWLVLLPPPSKLHVQPTLRNLITKTVVTEPESSAPLISNSAIGRR